MGLLAVSIAVAFGVSFLCSLVEATLLSLTPSQVADISRRRPTIGGIWQHFKSDIERPIAVILIMNTAAHTAGASVAGARFGQMYGDKWIWVFSAVFTVSMIQFTEILPKTLGVRFNRQVAALAAGPLKIGVWVFAPLLRLIHWVNRPLQPKHSESVAAGPTAIEEISALAGLASLSRQISGRQERIIKGAMRLSSLTVGQMMIPVEQVAFLSTSQDISEALVTAHIDAHTRFPICENGDRDRIAGYVNFKELVYFMATNPNDPSLRGVIRPVLSAQPEMAVTAMLEIFANRYGHMAVVQDASGKTLGIVTMEDIVEEMLGDIKDEFDRLPETVHALHAETWMAGGGATMAEVAKQTGLALPTTQEKVSDWLVTRLGKAPVSGAKHVEGGGEFLIRRTRRGKAFEVLITRQKGHLP